MENKRWKQAVHTHIKNVGNIYQKIIRFHYGYKSVITD
jgi:hypothetical protein